MAKTSKVPAAAGGRRAEVHWEGTSKEVLSGWPAPIRVDFGHSLNEMQEGRPATLAVRPMPSVGNGVFELKTEDEAAWYRLMYVARIDDVIHVLDCFTKKSRKTGSKDIDRSVARYQQVQLRLLRQRRGREPADREERRDGKRKQTNG